MNDLDRVPDGPSSDKAETGEGSWPVARPHRPTGMEEVQAQFLHAPLAQPRARRQTIGVRLNRIGRAGLIVPDVAALPRPLRDRHVKRALDLVLASALLIVLAVPMALVGAVLMAGGGALFVQPRVGRNRTRFDCLKFRTMRPDAEARLAAVLAADPAARAEWKTNQKLTDDPRVTRLGQILRRSSMDELPQLFNVLRGEISLVGPRPIVAPEVDGYPSDHAYYHSPGFEDYAGCLPGLTGLWQVAGRHRAVHADRVHLDRVYARNWSVPLDLKILWRTVAVVLSGSGR